ncbi:MAG: hypothetical protein ABFS05_05695 [Bacteroidota bacterium]
MSLEEILFDSSRAAADMAVEVIVQKPEIFDEAYQICMAQEGQKALRAARVVQLIAEQHPEILQPYFSDLVHRLPDLTHSSVKRCMTKVLTFYDVTEDEEIHGIIIDACFKRMNDFGEEIATRAYATRVLQRFTKIYPEITGELIAALQLLIDNSKETLSRYSQNILKELYRDAAP